MTNLQNATAEMFAAQDALAAIERAAGFNAPQSSGYAPARARVEAARGLYAEAWAARAGAK